MPPQVPRMIPPKTAGYQSESPVPNLVANLAGTGWSSILGIALVPVYVRVLGIESYGLIGLFAAMVGILQAFDFGLTPTMHREMARYSTSLPGEGEVRSFVRTLEVCYGSVGLALGVGIMVLGPGAAGRWIKSAALPVDTVEKALALMGLVIIFQWPLSLYIGGLQGLHRQVRLNAVRILLATAGAVGIMIILLRVSPTIGAFFTWQALVSAVQLLALRALLWHELPQGGSRPRVSVSLIRGVGGFALGMSGITVSGLILANLDKVILSRLLPLSGFGYYSLAVTIATGLGLMIVVPIYNVFFPRFAALIAAGEFTRLRKDYHLGAQVMAVLVVPTAAVIALFSRDLVLIWTGSLEAALNVAPVLSVMIMGTALNGLMFIPYALQLAHGWTALALRLSFVFVLLAVPSIIVMSTRFGARGAALVWAVQNLIYVIAGVPLTHRRVLVGEAREWLIKDFAYPLCAVLVVAVGLRLAWFQPLSPAASALRMAVTLAASACAAALAASKVRQFAFRLLSGR